MLLCRCCLGGLLRGRMGGLERLLRVYCLANALGGLGGTVYVRKDFVLRVESRSRGLLPLYKGFSADPMMQYFLRSYIVSDFIDLLLFFIKVLGDVRVHVKGRVQLIMVEDFSSVSLEREPTSYLAKVSLSFPGLFRDGRVDLSVRDYLYARAIEAVRRGLSGNLSIESYGVRGPWRGLNGRQVGFLVRSLRNYSLEELYSIFASLNPSRSDFELRAGLDIFEYGRDVAEFFLSVLGRFKGRAVCGRLGRAVSEVEAAVLGSRDKLNPILPDRGFVEWLLESIEHLSEWARIDRSELRRMLPFLDRSVVIRLWERSMDDLFMGFYAGTCIALDDRKVMHEYIFDPYTIFFRIYVNEKPIGHVKVFICRDEDGEVVLHIDYIGLAGGKYRRLHDALKLYSLSAVVRYAMSKGYRRVYVARDIVQLPLKPVENRLAKLGRHVYSQYLDSDKFLIWSSST